MSHLVQRLTTGLKCHYLHSFILAYLFFNTVLSQYPLRSIFVCPISRGQVKLLLAKDHFSKKGKKNRKTRNKQKKDQTGVRQIQTSFSLNDGGEGEGVSDLKQRTES